MNLELLKKLRNWRNAQAAQENVALYYILANKTLEEIADKEPKTKAELLDLPGIGEKKFNKYGVEILRLITEPVETGDKAVDEILAATETGEKIFSVSTFLDLINIGLRKHFQARVKGEVSEFRQNGGHYYFKLKDKEDGSCLDCFVWSNVYKMNGVELTDGIEIIVSGYPAVFKRFGSFKLNAETIELVGEGALKIAYEKLKAKLTEEGLFALESKRTLPAFPHKIGLITSETGAVIHDFMTNLGKFGYHIVFRDSRVEGQQAVADLLSAVEYFKNQDIDVLVIIRGGGAWESLQAFNNEMLARAVRAFPKPVLAGIGHDKDVTLVAMAADLMVSTPTATAQALNRTWEQATAKVVLAEQMMLAQIRDLFTQADRRVTLATQTIEGYFRRVFESFHRAEAALGSHVANFNRVIADAMERLRDHYRTILRELKRGMTETTERIAKFEQAIELYNPERPLRLGYSIARVGTKIVKSVKDVTLGEALDVRVSDGTIRADIISLKNVNYGEE